MEGHHAGFNELGTFRSIYVGEWYNNKVFPSIRMRNKRHIFIKVFLYHKNNRKINSATLGEG